MGREPRARNRLYPARRRLIVVVMKAIGYEKCLPVSDPASLIDFELPAPTPGAHDLLIEVKAVSVNPVDTKLRANRPPPPGARTVLGFDAAGVVQAVGDEVTLFKPGDEVFYAGVWDRPGTNAELHLEHEAIVGFKPKSLSYAQAAALPLTSITAWELLFDRLQVPHKNAGALLIIAGAGGVGSILTQLARQLTDAKIIATASRPETKAWCLELGAHHVIDHAQPMPPQLRELGPIAYIASLTNTQGNWPALYEIVMPQGRIGVIDDPKTLDVVPLKLKCASLHWEFMFARGSLHTPDMIEQHRSLTAIAKMIDAGTLRTTLGEHLGTINAANLRRAHALVESGKVKGKVVLEGF
jgi:NADPH2:quinone reductase